MKVAWAFVKEVFIEFQKDEIIILSAAFVYYAALSIIPLLLFLLALVSLTVDWVAALADYVDGQMASIGVVMGAEMEKLINEALVDLRRGSLIATAISLVIVVWGASIVFRFLRISFRKIFGHLQQVHGAADAARELLQYSTVDRFWGFLLVLLVGVLFVASLIVLAVIQATLTYLGLSTTTRALYQLVDLALTLAIVICLVSLLYRFLPPVTLKFSLIAPGALAVAVGYALLHVSLVLYLQYIAPTNAFGALGVILVLLVFMYAGGLIFYIGAEVTKVRMMHQAAATSAPQQSPEQ